MTAPHINVRKVIAENLRDDYWLVMDEAGDVTEYSSAEAVVTAIKAVDAKALRKGVSTATVIEWRDVPAGFIPPEVIV